MFKEGCQIELSLFDARKWYSIFSILKPVSMAIKYDDRMYAIFKSGIIKKVVNDKLLPKIIHTEIKPIHCTSLLVGKIWLDSCIITGTRFKDAKDFTRQYMEMVEGVKW